MLTPVLGQTWGQASDLAIRSARAGFTSKNRKIRGLTPNFGFSPYNKRSTEVVEASGSILFRNVKIEPAGKGRSEDTLLRKRKTCADCLSHAVAIAFTCVFG